MNIEISLLSIAIYRFNAIPIKVPMGAEDVAQ
jgi:hypothetical protein